MSYTTFALSWLKKPMPQFTPPSAACYKYVPVGGCGIKVHPSFATCANLTKYTNFEKCYLDLSVVVTNSGTTHSGAEVRHHQRRYSRLQAGPRTLAGWPA